MHTNIIWEKNIPKLLTINRRLTYSSWVKNIDNGNVEGLAINAEDLLNKKHCIFTYFYIPVKLTYT